MRDLILELPEHYQASEPDAELQRVFSVMVQRLQRDQEFTLAQLLPSTASGWGLELWETAYGIPVDKTKSDKQRRQQILSKIKGVGTTTVDKVRVLASQYGAVQVLERNPEYAFEIVFENNLEPIEGLDSLVAIIDELKPAHLKVFYSFSYRHRALSLSETDFVKQRIYHYGLGYWRLGERSFATDEAFRSYNYKLKTMKLGEKPFANAPKKMQYNYHLGSMTLGMAPFAQQNQEEVIKMDIVSSIKPEFLEDTATFVAAQIVSARVNRNIAIESIEKMVSGTTVVVTYLEPNGTVITHVELLNEAGEVITEADVYVPAGAYTVLKHEIPVKEGN